jgi:hypothetical protein
MFCRIAFLNYSGTESFHPSHVRGNHLGKSLRRKSFRPSRKTYPAAPAAIAY